MKRTHWGQHDGCIVCKAQTITVNPQAMPTRLNPKNEPKRPDPAWEKGIPTDSRGMPYLTKDGSPMGVKQFSEERHQIEEHRRKLHNSTTPIDL